MVENEQLIFSFVQNNSVAIEKKDETSENTVEVQISQGTGTFLEPVVKSMYGSPVLSDADISVYDSKEFDCVVEWSHCKRLRKCLDDESFFDLGRFRDWAWSHHLETLIEPGKTEEIMSLEKEDAVKYLKKLSHRDLDSFAGHCVPQFLRSILPNDWELAVLDVGIALTSRLGVLRLGKAKVSKTRTWVGRLPAEGAPKQKLDLRSEDLMEIGGAFLECFGGPGCREDDWTLGYRGGLWRFSRGKGRKKRHMYVEEFGEDEL